MGRWQATTSSEEPFASLVPNLQYFASNSLAENTKRAYATGINQYKKFFYGFKLQKHRRLLPSNEVTLCYFAVFMAKSVKHDTIKSYLAAIKHFHLVNCFNLKLENFLQLQFILRGIKRSQNPEQRTRLPILKCHLQVFQECLLKSLPRKEDNLMLWAAICLAFFGFLRISEFTCSEKFHPALHLSRSDITFSPSFEEPISMSVVIKGSKTDPFRKGVSLIIGRSYSPICAVSAVKDYLEATTYRNGPLFQYSDGRYLTKGLFTTAIRQFLTTAGYKPQHYAGHSFRIGAATSAASAKLPPWLIKDLGRWTSDCYERYIRTPSNVFIKASQILLG